MERIHLVLTTLIGQCRPPQMKNCLWGVTHAYFKYITKLITRRGAKFTMRDYHFTLSYLSIPLRGSLPLSLTLSESWFFIEIDWNTLKKLEIYPSWSPAADIIRLITYATVTINSILKVKVTRRVAQKRKWDYQSCPRVSWLFNFQFWNFFNLWKSVKMCEKRHEIQPNP